MATVISTLHGREVLDSRGTPTLEVEIELSDGSLGRAMVPSGASKGEHEALELRDADPKRFLGKGVLQAVRNVNENISKALLQKSFSDLKSLDDCLIEIDGTEQKKKLGANTILGVSLAFAHALARSQKRDLYLIFNELMGLRESNLSMPTPLMNILNGGVHANNGLEIQEFMIVPHGFSTFSDALRAGTEVFMHLKAKLHDQAYSTAVGDEGGFAPSLESNEMALELICEAIEKSGYQLGTQISLALDVASSSFFNRETEQYDFRWKQMRHLSGEVLIEFYKHLKAKYPLVSIEDGLDENDWGTWKKLTHELGPSTQLVGDDLFVTQKKYVERGIKEKVANAILIKVNQVGTLSETMDTMNLGSKHHYRSVVSHRSGETEDVTIAHLAVGSGCGQIKTGSLSRGERTAKYNELLRIEEKAFRRGRPIRFENAFRA
ncbi:MAG: phosphopyruvate hydratase [Proteobacteria bacterium]|nr:phosphopyruvate hydratase [Pseudomonadota bacterium]NDC23885.1 phosphopyruvate hydratase [Pseudomonadota bacterium]NDD03287.1 phosphopyruvate hydratase [Pseudomonadota bacterium]NDG25974.1 phosphopyruvate hydratase [Pseudomonadota bacterium]